MENQTTLNENPWGAFWIGIILVIGSIIYSIFMYSIGYTFFYGVLFGVIGVCLIIGSIHNLTVKKVSQLSNAKKHYLWECEKCGKEFKKEKECLKHEKTCNKE